jgi:hypothetical protein
MFMLQGYMPELHKFVVFDTISLEYFCLVYQLMWEKNRNYGGNLDFSAMERKKETNNISDDF